MSEKNNKTNNKDNIKYIPSIEEERKDLLADLNRAYSGVIASQEDYNSKSIASILAKRQKDALSIINSISVTEDKPENGNNIIDFLLSPGVSFILGCASMVSIVPNLLARHIAIPMIVSLVFTVQALFRARFDVTNNRKSTFRTGINKSAAEAFIIESRNAIIQDTQTITSLLSAKGCDRDADIQDLVVNQFCLLYEAVLDNPQDNDFSYSLTLTRKMLERLDISEVPYSEKSRNLFITDSVEYPSQMRCPALIKKDSKILVKMGEYIQDCRTSGGN